MTAEDENKTKFILKDRVEPCFVINAKCSECEAANLFIDETKVAVSEEFIKSGWRIIIINNEADYICPEHYWRIYER